MAVVKVIPESFKAYFGFNYESLTPAAEVHEGTMDFKAAFSAMFESRFKNVVPVTMPMVAHADLAPTFDATGHADATAMHDFLETVLNQNRATSVPSFTLGPDLYAVCIRTPTGWLIINGYEVKMGGADWTLDEAVTKYVEAKAIPTAQQSALDGIRTLKVLMYTQHERVHLAESAIGATGVSN